MSNNFKLCVWEPQLKADADSQYYRYLNREIDFEIPEALQAELLENMLEALMERKHYCVDPILRITIHPPKSDEMSDIIRKTNAWREIEKKIGSSCYKTGPLTRICLYAELFSNRSFRSMAKKRIRKSITH